MALRNKSITGAPVTTVLGDQDVPIYNGDLTADEEVLIALGYKPEFKREFSLWTSFCLSFAVLGLLPSFASTLLFVRSSIFFSPSSHCQKRYLEEREADET